MSYHDTNTSGWTKGTAPYFHRGAYERSDAQGAVCELVYKPEAWVEYMTGRSIKIVYKIARPVDLKFGV